MNDIFIYFFIQGFNTEGTIKEILKRRLDYLKEAKKIVWIVEDINKQQEQI